MTVLILIFAFLLGAFLRRMFGGWIGWSRSVCTAMIVTASAAPFWWFWHDLTPWIFGIPIFVKALICTAAVWLHWVDGHDFSKPWKLAYRYSMYLIPIALVTGAWWVLLAGPIAAVSIIGFKAVVPGPITFPWDDPPRMVMWDGYEGVWESLGLGGPSFVLIWSAALFGAGVLLPL